MVTSGLFTKSNLTQVEDNTKHAKRQETTNSFDNKMSSSGKYKQTVHKRRIEKEEVESNEEDNRQF